MSIDVRGPKGPQINALPTTQGPAKAGPTGITGAQALQNAEGMFAKSFEKLGESSAVNTVNLASIGAPQLKDNLHVPQVKQEILAVFQELKAQHLNEKPTGPTAQAFEHPTLLSLVSTFTAVEVETQITQLLDETPLADLPPQAQRALRQINDVKFASKLDGIMTSDQLQSTPEYQFFASPKAQTLMKQAAPHIVALVAHLTGKTKDAGPSKTHPFGKASPGDKVGSSGEKAGSKAAGSAPPAAPPAEADDAVVQLFDQLSPVVSSAMRMFGENMDVSSMIIIMMGLLAKDAEGDLKDMMKTMQHNLQIKNAKREMKRALEDDMKKMNETAQAQLDQLKKDNLVPQDLSLTDYLAYCQVDAKDPVLNEETGDWQTFPPTLSPPSPLPADWRCEFDPPASKDGGLHLTGPGLFRTFSQNVADGKDQSSYATFFGNMSEQAWENLIKTSGKSKEQWGALLGEMGIPKPANLSKASDPYGAAPQGNGNRMQSQIDKLTDDIDSMGSQSELDQTRMQLYMDRRAKAFETLSNLQKKISDSLAGIIKNQT
jgi:hypothetical protein